jgi:hypothetical protein
LELDPACPPGRSGFKHQNIEALRGRINARRQAGRPGTDDDEVADSIIVNLLIHTQIGRNFFVAGVFEHDGAAADQHRQVSGLHMEFFQQFAYGSIRVDVQIYERIAVAREKLLQPLRTGCAGGTEQDHVAGLRGHEQYAPQYISAHEELAQFRIRLKDGAQVWLIDCQDLSAFPNAHADHRTDTAQRTHVSGKAPLGVHDDQRLARRRGLQDLDAARQNHEHGETITRLGQYLTLVRSALTAVHSQPRDLHRVEVRKHLSASPTVGRLESGSFLIQFFNHAQAASCRDRRKWKNSTPSRNRRFIISGLAIISATMDAILEGRK